MINKYEEVHQFLRSYFHQDWKIEHKNPYEVLDHFIRNTSREYKQQVLSDIDKLINDNDVSVEAKNSFIKESAFVNFSEIDPLDWLRYVFNYIINMRYVKTKTPILEVYIDLVGHSEVAAMIQVIRNAKTGEVIDADELYGFTLDTSFVDTMGRIILIFKE